jgi:hypothetical protein
MSRSHRSQGLNGAILDKTPRGNSPEGFFDRDTGRRPIALMHPSNTEAAKKLVKQYDVYIWRMTPPNAAYIVPRDQWPEMQGKMMESLERYLEDGR